MGRSNQKRHHHTTKSHTLPSSPTHSSSSSSSSDFEFTISLSPRKSSAALCLADELFYKGQLLPLHLSPRLSMVRTLLLSSASTSSSSDTTTTASRDSTASDSSSADLLCSDSSRPSSATDDEFKRLANNTTTNNDVVDLRSKPSKYFSLAKISSVFLKPLYEKLSQKQQQQQQQQQQKTSRTPPPRAAAPPLSSGFSRSANTTFCVMKDTDHEFMKEINPNSNFPNSFSGNLRCPRRRRSCISSCPSSMMSSPRRGESGFGFTQMGRVGCNSDVSSMEELQSAIQGAIAHCKNSMMKNKNLVSNEI
ncbi:hypothetical protein DH2020_049030 [Rehmannia glutinosa]|uniref:Membrane-associated kinase regulator 1 n=1 Tax=Rehmannia glutinosa TaxID=99300 RepID=A0ABR0U415_REHGL